jgi:hypothetical protein
MSLLDSLGETNKKASAAGEKFLKSSYNYYKLKIFQQLTISIGLIFKIIFIGGLIIIALGFMATAFALFLGEVLDNPGLGFVLAGVLFLCLSLIAYLFRKHMNSYIVKILSEKFFN